LDYRERGNARKHADFVAQQWLARQCFFKELAAELADVLQLKIARYGMAMA
jgi:hypothetical protein